MVSESPFGICEEQTTIKLVCMTVADEDGLNTETMQMPCDVRPAAVHPVHHQPAARRKRAKHVQEAKGAGVGARGHSHGEGADQVAIRLGGAHAGDGQPARRLHIRRAVTSQVVAVDGGAWRIGEPCSAVNWRCVAWLPIFKLLRFRAFLKHLAVCHDLPLGADAFDLTTSALPPSICPGAAVLTPHATQPVGLGYAKAPVTVDAAAS